MSLSFHLFRAPAGRDPLEWARLHYHGGEEDVPDSCTFPPEERLALSRSLLAADPRLKSEAEEDGSYWLTDEAGEVDYEVLEDSLLVCVSKFIPAERVEPVIREVLRVMGVVAAGHGLLVYDPSGDHVLDPAADPAELLARYRRAVGSTPAPRSGGSAPSRVVLLVAFVAALFGVVFFGGRAPLIAGGAFLVLTAWLALTLRRP